jgi:hypothetical protein
MPYSWTTSAAIEFQSNGVKVMGDLAASSKRLAASMKALQATVDGVNASLDTLIETAAKATDAVAGLNSVMGKSAASSRSGATASERAAAGYNIVAVAAERATASVAALDTASQAQRALPPADTIGIARRMGGGGGRMGGGGGIGDTLGGIGGAIAGAAPWGRIGHSAMHYGVDAAEAASAAAVDAVYEAGNLQRQMTLIQVATGANAAQKARIEQEAYKIAAETAQSVRQSAAVIGVAASSGINDPEKLLARDKQGHSFAEIIAKFADVQFLKSHGGVSFEEATKQGIKLAHLYGAYSPDQIAPLLDQVTKASFMMPDGLDKYLTQSSYYTKLFGRAGVPQEQTTLMGAWLDRTGGGKRGGTWLQDLLLHAMNAPSLTTSRGGLQRNALEHFGIINSKGAFDPKIFGNDKTGKPTLDFFGLLTHLNSTIEKDIKGKSPADAAKAQRDDIMNLIKAFGIQGGRAALLADVSGIQNLLQMQKDMKKAPGVEQGQAMFIGNFLGREGQAWSNFQSLMTEIGGQALPGLTKGFFDFGNALHDAQTWLHAHGQVEIDIQRDITNAVKETERWVSSHRADWINLAKDAKRFMDNLPQLVKQIESLGDALLGLYNVVSAMSKWPIFQILGKSPDDATKKDRLDNLFFGRQRDDKLVQDKDGGHHWSTAATPSDGTSDLAGNIIIHQMIDARGATDPNAVKTAVSAGSKTGVSAAIQKARNHGALFTLPNAANISIFGPAVLGAH